MQHKFLQFSYVQMQHRLLLSIYVQVQLRSLLCRTLRSNMAPVSQISQGFCRVDTFRCSSGPYGEDMSRAAYVQAPIVLTSTAQFPVSLETRVVAAQVSVVQTSPGAVQAPEVYRYGNVQVQYRLLKSTETGTSRSSTGFLKSTDTGTSRCSTGSCSLDTGTTRCSKGLCSVDLSRWNVF